MPAGNAPEGKASTPPATAAASSPTSDSTTALLVMLDSRFARLEEAMIAQTEILRRLPSSLGAAVASHTSLAGSGAPGGGPGAGVFNAAQPAPSSNASLTFRDPNAKKPDVPVGLSFQISNLYELDAANSRFSVDVLVNLSWVDPGLKAAVQNGDLKKDLGSEIWSQLQPGWQFRDFTSDALIGSAVMNDVIELRPVLELMNSLSVESIPEPVALQDLHRGRVGYTVRYQGSFDEIFELQAFPFDIQVPSPSSSSPSPSPPSPPARSPFARTGVRHARAVPRGRRLPLRDGRPPV